MNPFAQLRTGMLLNVILLTAMGCTPQAPPAAAPSLATATRCLPTGDGYLRARLQGAREVNIDWHDAEISCEGGLRPEARGIRVSIAGPLSPNARLRFVFGIGAVAENQAGRALPTNLTAILESEHRIFATLGDDKCTVDSLAQTALPGGSAQGYRVEARGFCIAPATAVGGTERLLVSTFDFAGRIDIEADTKTTDKLEL